MNNITKIKSVLAEINELRGAGFIVTVSHNVDKLTRALDVAVDSLKDIEGRYENPHDLHNINSARLRGCQLEAKSSIDKISEILEVKP